MLLELLLALLLTVPDWNAGDVPVLAVLERVAVARLLTIVL